MPVKWFKVGIWVMVLLICAGCAQRRLADVAVSSAQEAVTETPPPVAESLTPFITPTETLKPPLPLPTPEQGMFEKQSWTGQPTYPGDSSPGMLFRLEYDPLRWARTEDEYGQPALAHRLITYCVIAPTAGRGLPPDWTVAHELRSVGEVSYEVNTASQGDRVTFVNYLGGDNLIYTGFQVSFQEQMEQCLQEAEVVLATLRSIAEAEVTPIP